MAVKKREDQRWFPCSRPHDRILWCASMSLLGGHVSVLLLSLLVVGQLSSYLRR
jgi:hypothetical protein